MAATLRQRLPIEVVQSETLKTPSITSSDTSEDPLDDSNLLPFTPPSFTIKDLLGAIPAHCFERSALKSSSYVVADFIMIGTIMYAATFIDPAFGAKGSVLQGPAGIAAKWALWAAYWTMAGWNFTG